MHDYIEYIQWFCGKITLNLKLKIKLHDNNQNKKTIAIKN